MLAIPAAADGGEVGAASVAFAIYKVAVGATGLLKHLFAGGRNTADFLHHQPAHGAHIGSSGGHFPRVELPGAGHFGRQTIGDRLLQRFFVRGLFELGSPQIRTAAAGAIQAMAECAL